MAPKPVGFRAPGVKTPYGLNYSDFRYIYIFTAFLIHVTSFGSVTPKPVGFRALGVKTPLQT